MKLDKKVQQAWKERKKIRSRASELDKIGYKLCSEGHNFDADAKTLHAESYMLFRRGMSCYADMDKLCADGDILFLEAVVKAYGNIPIKWNVNDSCTLFTNEGEITLK